MKKKPAGGRHRGMEREDYLIAAAKKTGWPTFSSERFLNHWHRYGFLQGKLCKSYLTRFGARRESRRSNIVPSVHGLWMAIAPAAQREGFPP